MAQLHWRYEELPWDSLDRSKVDPDLVPLIKAASLVEFNADDYTAYLCNVFKDDPAFQQAAHDWAVEEVQHGRALGRWAELVDPDFNFERAVQRFRAGYSVPVDLTASVRGSRSGELIARCMVETGTSSYYTAIADSTDEPLLKLICRNVAADELRHYKLFYGHAKRYLEAERLTRWQRLKVALARIGETEDDELAYAYYAANAPEGAPYDRKTFNAAYAKRAWGRYQQPHVERAIAMVFKACGLKPHTTPFKLATKVAWWLIAGKAKRSARAGA